MMSQQFRLKIRAAVLSKAVILLLFSIPIYACGVLCLVHVLDIIIILSCVAFISQRKNRAIYFKPFKPNGIYHFYQLDQSISV